MDTYDNDEEMEDQLGEFHDVVKESRGELERYRQKTLAVIREKDTQIEELRGKVEQLVSQNRNA